MAWSTVVGLIVICALCVAAAAWITAIYHQYQIRELEDEIEAAEKALSAAVDAQPDNLVEHNRLRTLLCGLRKRLADYE